MNFENFDLETMLDQIM